MKLVRRTAKRGRIEIIPMIDTILILLIFYMTFSTFRAKEKILNASLPTPPDAGQRGRGPAPPPEIVLHVFDRDRIVVNGHTTLDADTLGAILAQAAGNWRDTRVVIEAEPTTRYEHVVNALDACAGAQLTRVGFREARE